MRGPEGGSHGETVKPSLAIPGCCYDGQLQCLVWERLQLDTTWKVHIVAGDKTSVTDKPAPLAGKARQGVNHREEQLDNARTVLSLQNKMINGDHLGLQHHRTNVRSHRENGCY